METKNLADLYHLDSIPWSTATEALEATDAQKETPFLATTRPDGRPHVAGIGALWIDGKFYFVSGAKTRKSQNLAENPNCAISVSLKEIDLVVEGTASKVTHDETLHHVAERYGAQGWPATVKDGAFTHEYSAPSAGPPPWDVYVLKATTAYGVLTIEPGGATRWRFDD